MFTKLLSAHSCTVDSPCSLRLRGVDCTRYVYGLQSATWQGGHVRSGRHIPVKGVAVQARRLRWLTAGDDLTRTWEAHLAAYGGF